MAGSGPVLRVGTSGWQYRHFRGVLYGPDDPQRAWLEAYARAFPAVEANGTFYRLPERSTFEGWHDRTPHGFRFALKASRYLTHVRRLRDPDEPVARLLERAEPLGDRLGPILLQLPPDLRAEPERLASTLDAFPTGVQVAVEPRHESWWSDEVRSLLEERGAALCLADRGSRPITPLWRTTDWGYVRFHVGAASPEPHYGRTALHHWVDRIAERWSSGEEVWAFFNNDPGGWAVRDARTFGRRAERQGYEVVSPPG